MWTYNYNNELYHYGVLGMRWGVRRAERKAANARYKQKLKNTIEATKDTNREDAMRMKRNLYKGETFVTNTVAGALGGALVGVALRKMSKKTGKQAATMIAKSSLYGAAVGSLIGAKRVHDGEQTSRLYGVHRDDNE